VLLNDDCWYLQIKDLIWFDLIYCSGFAIAAQRNHKMFVYTCLWEIFWLLHISAIQCTTAQILRDGWESPCETPYFMPAELVLTQWTIFCQWTRWSSSSMQVASQHCWRHQLRQASSLSWQILWRHSYITTSKEYLTTNFCWIILN